MKTNTPETSVDLQLAITQLLKCCSDINSIFSLIKAEDYGSNIYETISLLNNAIALTAIEAKKINHVNNWPPVERLYADLKNNSKALHKVVRHFIILKTQNPLISDALTVRLNDANKDVAATLTHLKSILNGAVKIAR